MARITSLGLMEQYVLRKLGSPVIQVELSVDQVQQAIEDAVQVFQDIHTGEGNYQDVLAFNVTSGTSAYDVSELDLAGVLDLDLSFADPNGINVLFSPTHMLLFEDWVIRGGYPGGPGGSYNENSGLVLTNYEIAVEYLNDIKDMFGLKYNATFSDSRQELLIVPTPRTTGTGLIIVYRKNKAINLYNNRLVKRLAVAEAKIQWGSNLDKYTMTLPSGATINGARILSDGKEEKEKIMEDIIAESEGPMFFIE